jgi:GNAT superfamily N-acetyltransferase
MNAVDIPAGLDLCRLSRWNQIEEDWRFLLDSPGGGGWVAERDRAIRGTVGFLRYSQCYSWLSMMLVHPDHRRTGVGARLMQTVIDALASKSCVRLDATPLGVPLYRRFGFTGECELVRASITVAPDDFGPVPENISPMKDSDLTSIFTRDHKVFGADRSALLASFYNRARDLAWTAKRGDALLGYCFGRPGYLYRQLGPVVAEDASIARDLVVRCLHGQPAGTAVAVDVPRPKPEWITWLESVGFAIERPFLRMRRGENESCGHAEHQFATAGPEFG